MVLIVAPQDDLHATVVRDRLLARGVDCVVWDSTRLPWQDRMTWTLGGDATLRSDGQEISLAAVGKVWWRRSRGPTVDPLVEDSHVRRFCATEARELLQGVMNAGGAVTNRPAAERRAESKVLQLVTAARAGLHVPATVVSNDRDRLRAFADAHPRAVIKTLRCDYVTNIPVRTLEQQDLADPAIVALAPVVLQELVECDADVRVLVVGGRAHAAAMRRPDRNEHVDWRQTASGWEPHELPDDVADGLQRVLDALRLDSGSFDLRLRADGVYAFLEVNPGGQFLFLEVDAGLPVSEAMATHLAGATG